MKNGIAEKPEVKTVEWFDDRWYKIPKKLGTVDFYPSVTTILGIIDKPFLAKWRGDVGNREADIRLFEAQQRGTRIHSGWETICKGGAVVFNPPMRPNFTATDLEELSRQHTFIEVIKYQDEMYQLTKLKKFLEVVQPEIIASELVIWSDVSRFAGTIDNVFRIEAGEYLISGRTPVVLQEGIYIGDLKTGSTFDDNAHLQMAAYAAAYEEQTSVKPVGTIGIHTGGKTKTGIPGLSVYVRNQTEWQKDFGDFKLAAELWKRKHSEDRPETFELPTVLHMKKEPA